VSEAALTPAASSGRKQNQSLMVREFSSTDFQRRTGRPLPARTQEQNNVCGGGCKLYAAIMFGKVAITTAAFYRDTIGPPSSFSRLDGQAFIGAGHKCGKISAEKDYQFLRIFGSPLESFLFDSQLRE